MRRPLPSRREESRGPSLSALAAVLAAAAAMTACDRRDDPPADPEGARGPGVAAARPSDAEPFAGKAEPSPEKSPPSVAPAELYAEVVPEVPEGEAGLDTSVLRMLLEAMEGGDADMRAVAVENAGAYPPAARGAGDDDAGLAATAWWIGRLSLAPPAARAAIVQVLARRGDPVALPAVLAAMKDPDEGVRLAGIAAAAALGQEMVTGHLAAVLAGPGPAERDAARNALVELPGEAADAAIAASLDGRPPRVRCVLLDVLALRGAAAHADAVLACARDEDAAVRLAAIKALGSLARPQMLAHLLGILVEAGGARERRAAEKAVLSVCARTGEKDLCAGPVLAALRKADAGGRPCFLRILGQLGTAGALSAVRGALRDADETVRDAAVRALVAWPDPAAAPHVLDLARNAVKPTHRILALRGYVRMAAMPGARSAALGMYGTAMALAGRPDEKKLVLSGLAGVGSAGALRMALTHVDDEALRAEAALAVVKIARAVGRAHPDEASEALEKVVSVCRNEAVLARARKAMEAVRAPE